MKTIFISLAKDYTDNVQLTNDLWNEIERKYSKSNRHYHTLEHLERLLQELHEVQVQIREWNTILFTLFYHDAIYDPLKSNNEEKSADLAEKRLLSLSVPQQVISNCKAQILVTKQHEISADEDTNYFTDADLSILGQDWPAYEAYAKNVRKEYAIYPDLVYRPGRRKVLSHFLQMERIYKTGYFFGKYEATAKDNLQREISLLM